MADATPVQVVLEYLNGVSSWGPKTASGVAEIVRAEGEVRLSARGLPDAANAHYVLWLVREGSDVFFRVGAVSRQSDGTATVDLLLPDAIPNSGWNMALVTVEDNVNADHPGIRHALAGRYPRPLPQGTLPIGLPNTGAGGATSFGRSLVPFLPVPAAIAWVVGRHLESISRRRSSCCAE
jgi:hypothetical protein